MFRTIAPQQSLWASVLPEVARGLPPRLAELDSYFDDPRLFEPFRPYFHPSDGRPSLPIETYVRMMALKFRYQLGYEALCEEVSDSISWRLFCRVPLGERVPHPSTLEKITSRCGLAAVDQLNEALLQKGHEKKLVKLDKVRADTTVVPANVKYPTDSGLLAKGVARLVVLARQLKAMGLAPRTKMRDRRRSMASRAHSITTWLRRRSGEAKEEVLAITEEMAKIAEAALADARAVATSSARALRRQGDAASGRAKAVLAELKETAALLDMVIAQARRRVAGDMPEGSERIVSLHDRDARPIKKGRLGKPVEFGRKAQVVDNSDGVVVDHEVFQGNPPDAPQLPRAITRIKARFGRVPRRVAADHGYGEAPVYAELGALGVKKVVIPRKGKLSQARKRVESARGFRNLVKWRTGSEGRIAVLKHRFGWGRSLMDGTHGAATWCAWGIFAHNSLKLSHLAAIKGATPPPSPRRQRPPRPPGNAPPGAAPPPTPPLAA
jgi:IS5 family transposase